MSVIREGSNRADFSHFFVERKCVPKKSGPETSGTLDLLVDSVEISIPILTVIVPI